MNPQKRIKSCQRKPLLLGRYCFIVNENEISCASARMGRRNAGLSPLIVCSLANGLEDVNKPTEDALNDSM